jgi:hypothetical protein
MRYSGHLYGHIDGSGNPYGDSGVCTFSTLRGLQRVLRRQPYAVPSHLSMHVDRATERVIDAWVSQAGGMYTGLHGRLTVKDISIYSEE